MTMAIAPASFEAWRLAFAMISSVAIVIMPMLLFAAYTNRRTLRTAAEVIGGAALVLGFAIASIVTSSALPLVPLAIGIVGVVAVMMSRKRSSS